MLTVYSYVFYPFSGLLKKMKGIILISLGLMMLLLALSCDAKGTVTFLIVI